MLSIDETSRHPIESLDLDDLCLTPQTCNSHTSPSSFTPSSSPELNTLPLLPLLCPVANASANVSDRPLLSLLPSLSRQSTEIDCVRLMLLRLSSDSILFLRSSEAFFASSGSCSAVEIVCNPVPIPKPAEVVVLGELRPGADHEFMRSVCTGPGRMAVGLCRTSSSDFARREVSSAGRRVAVTVEPSVVPAPAPALRA